MASASAIGLAGSGLLAMAALSQTWRSPADERIRSFTIVTTTPNELCAELQHRVRVVLKPASLARLAQRAAGRSSALEGPVRPLPFR